MDFDDNYIKRAAYTSRRQKQRKRQRAVRIFLIILSFGILLAFIGIGTYLYRTKDAYPELPGSEDSTNKWIAESTDASSVLESTLPQENGEATDSIELSTDNADGSKTISIPVGNSELQTLLENANALAMGYDYDGAIEFLQSNETYADHEAVVEALAKYEAVKATLVRIDPTEVTHVFFHSLIMDNAKAFDGDSDTAGYNQVMTTSREFLKMMEQMYERGYVLVKMHDLAYETTDENGKTVFKAGDIMLPPGKKAFVMSQDDVCYYEYMEGDGFASRIIIGEDGKPTCEMVMDDGTVSVGSYDLVPILEDFIAEHPDFSYKGARAVLAFTGYQGILGYRTDPAYKDSNPNYEADRETAKKVAQCLRDNGWELASHSWGHINMSERNLETIKTDADKWEARVESLIGETDIILYPFGADIGDWRPYTTANEKFNYLYELGFRYFCNVDGNQHWVQIGDKFMRQGRRNLDGYRMYYDLPQTNPQKTYLDDLFDVTTVFDPDRPTPVPMM